jgi:hypothetical protein
MGVRFRLTASVLAMAAALCAGAAAGRVVGPIRVAGAPTGPETASGERGTRLPDRKAVVAASADEHASHRTGAAADDPPATATTGGDGGGGRDAGDATPGTEGLLATAAGYTFVAETTQLDGLPGTPFRFRITDPAGAVVHGYAVTHERELHLVIVSRDLAVYHHLHPTLEADGTWTVALPALTPGAYRAFADFTVTDGPALTLGLDLLVPGGALYSPLPPPTGLVEVHGYDVSLTGAPALADASSDSGSDGGIDSDGGEVALTVSSGGAPVTDLEPYLGAPGHLVVIRSSDLAFVHAHPIEGESAADGSSAAGPTVRFHVVVGAPGDYRLFFEFAHAGVVHAAPFTVHVPPPPP